MNETVIILGTASTLNITPWDNPAVDYWACAPVITHRRGKDGPLLIHGHRIDALFEIHPISYWSDPQITDRLNNFSKSYPNTPIYMQDKYTQIVKSEKYPLIEVQSFINHPRLRKYFTSTIAYMIILAIMRGYKRIELFGIHMSSGEEEYSLQRECCSALLAFGWGRGVDFWLPDESDIMKSTHLYGYEQHNGILLKAIHFKDQVAKGEKELGDKLDKMEQDYWQQKGGVVIMEKFIDHLKKEGMI